MDHVSSIKSWGKIPRFHTYAYGVKESRSWQDLGIKDILSTDSVLFL